MRIFARVESIAVLVTKKTLALALSTIALTSCSVGGEKSSVVAENPSASSVPQSTQTVEAPPGTWAPAPATTANLTVLATANAKGLALKTTGGTRDFIAGVNLGVTTPGHLPGEHSITAEQYRRWFEQMGTLGIRSVRIYTIHPPAFYQELAAYNRAHPADPLYLVQGVYLPNEDWATGNGTLYDPAVDKAFEQEVFDAALAVRGALTRDEAPGRPFGTWDTDVSPWLLSWLIGVEWDPEGVLRTDKAHTDAPAIQGTYFRSAPKATPTEKWLTRHMDNLADIEARSGRSMPIAFTNWPTTDPLAHPEEPHPAEDLVGIDANNVQPTTAWPGGTFASYHAYPYYPDFLQHEPGLQKPGPSGKIDPYAAYLTALKKHHQGMAVLITELGVPSGMGSAHDGPLGRDQGDHSEQEAMTINAELLRLVKTQGLSGAYLFIWADEWFKMTWNTVEHQIPAQSRQLWHDPLTNEQYFGLMATDATPLDGARRTIVPDPATGLKQVTLDADPSYLYLTADYADASMRQALGIEVDTVAGGAPTAGNRILGGPETADYVFRFEPTTDQGVALVRQRLAPARWDTWEKLPEHRQDWHPYRLVTNRAYDTDKISSPLATQNLGVLRSGTWSPDAKDHNSLATWRVEGTKIHVRLPWAMVGISDPSSRMALSEGSSPTAEQIEHMGLTVFVNGEKPLQIKYSWPTWSGPDQIGHIERLKSGVDTVSKAYHDLND